MDLCRHLLKYQNGQELRKSSVESTFESDNLKLMFETSSILLYLLITSLSTLRYISPWNYDKLMKNRWQYRNNEGLVKFEGKSEVLGFDLTTR